MNQQNDQWVIGVAPGKRRMNGLVMKRITKGNGSKLQWVVELAACMSDHSRNHSHDDERTALGLSRHGEAFEGEEEGYKRVSVERGLIYAVAKMSRDGADLSWGLEVLNLELKLFPEILILKVDCLKGQERVFGYQEGDDQMEA